MRDAMHYMYYDVIHCIFLLFFVLASRIPVVIAAVVLLVLCTALVCYLHHRRSSQRSSQHLHVGYVGHPYMLPNPSPLGSLSLYHQEELQHT